MDAELKTAVEKLGHTFEEFKKNNDAIIAQKAKGVVDPLLVEQDAKMQGAMDDFSAQKTALEDLLSRVDDMEVKGGRPGQTQKEKDTEDHKKAFGDFLRKGAENGLSDLQVKATSIGSDPDGGYAVPQDLDSTISQLERDDTPMRQVCRVLPVSNENYEKLFNLGGAASGWVGETTARTITDSPTLAKVAPVFGEIYANPASTQRSLDDVMFSVEAWLATEVAREFAEQENVAFVSGNGTNKPSGILNATLSTDADGTRTFGEVQYRVSGTSAAFDGDDLIDIVYDLKAGYRRNGRWMLANDSLRLARKLKDTEGNYLWRPGLIEGQPASLIGYSITENEDLPAVAGGANSILFGDFMRGYLIVDVRGTRVLRDPFTNKPYVHFYSTKRVGGIVDDSQAIKVLQLGA